MEAGAGRSRRSKWRKFKRKYGPAFLISLAILAIVALTGFVMYILTSPNFRVRWNSNGF